jgi:hypothetical protein
MSTRFTRPWIHAVDPTPPNEPQAGGGGAPAPAADPAPADGGDDGRARALAAERQRAADLEKETKALRAQLKELGRQVDPQVIAEAQRRADDAERLREVAEAEARNRAQALEQKHNKVVDELKAAMEARALAAERAALRIKAEREFLASEGRPEAGNDGRTHFDYLWDSHGAKFAEDQNGLYLVDADGTPRLDPETKKRLTPAEYFAQLRDDSVAGVHFRPRFGTGGGSRSGWDGEVDHTTDLQKIPHATLGEMAFTKAGGRR